MTRSILSRVSIGTAITLISTAAVVPMAGCESGGFGGLMGSQSAMDMLTPLVKDAANSYVGNLSSLTNSLGELQNLQGVMDFVKKAEPMVKELYSSYQTLSGTTGEERSNLMEAFGQKINSANSEFLDQSESVTSNGTWAQMLSPVLNNIPLFQ